MGAAERAKGNRAELAVVTFLRECGWNARSSRSAQGVQGGEDILWDGPAAIEVKDHARLDLAGWVDQARRQAGSRPAVVWHKRRGKGSPAGWYVTMTGEDFVRLCEKDDAVR